MEPKPSIQGDPKLAQRLQQAEPERRLAGFFRATSLISRP